MDTNIDMNFHHVLEISLHKCHYLYMDWVNKHRFLHSVIRQTLYSIGIRNLPENEKKKRSIIYRNIKKKNVTS